MSEKTSLNLMLFGTTGRVGRHLLAQALDAGHRVTAVVREPAKITTEHDHLTVLKGDISSRETLDRASVAATNKDGAIDAVLSTLGIFQREQGTPLADGTSNLVSVMNDYGVKRLIAMSSVGIGDSTGQGNFLVKILLKTRLKYVVIDKNKQEGIIRGNDLNWTIIRPPQIVPGDKTGDYYQWSGTPDGRKIKWKITCGDAAHSMLSKVTDEDTFNNAYQVAY